MVRGRVLGLVVAVAVAIGGACVKRQTQGSSQVSGTCEGACQHYVSCKRTDDPRALRECVRDCSVIYTDEGVEDTETLGLFERLDCEEAISFVEGSTAKK